MANIRQHTGSLNFLDAELRAPENHFRTIFENSPIDIALIGLDQKFIAVNQAAVKMHGSRSAAELLRTPLLSLVDPASYPTLAKAWLRVLKDGYVSDVELTQIRRDGKKLNTLASAVLLRDSRGNPYAVLAMVQDVTERKKTEAALRQSEKMFHELIDSIPQLAWIISPSGRVEYANQRYLEFTGATLTEIQVSGGAMYIHPEEREWVMRRWGNCLRTGRIFELEFRILNQKTGKYEWFLTRGIPVRDASGKIEKWFGTNTNITEIMELENRKNEFISIASHELKTPITSIKGFTELVARGLKKNCDDHNLTLVKKIENQVNRLTSLVSDFLDISRIESGNLSLVREKFDLYALVQEVVSDTRLMSTQGPKIVFRGKKKTFVTADRFRIAQVLTNLLTNAVRFSPKSGKVVVTLSVNSKYATVSVKDYGIGIPLSSQPHLFKKFFQVHPARRTLSRMSNLGLGLYISSEIIRRHRGKIWVKSQEGSGALFAFSLPLPARP